MSVVLETRSVSVRVGAKSLLDDVTLAFAAGETVAIIGPNGAGKTTLLRALSGDLRPEYGRVRGEVRLKGRDVVAYAPRLLAAHRAVLSQHVAVAFSFTVADIVAMGAGDRGGPQVAALVEAALAEVDLAGFAERIITTLSGGEQQRAHLARVLVQLACGETAHGPGVLLLDEPTASLDLRHQLTVAACARRRAEGGTAVIAIVHDLNLATLLADRVVVLDRGRVAGDGSSRDVITDAMLERVFGVTGGVGRVPAAGVPFVLPQGLGATT
jgi:iron complex transport system ATP-binding protein